ncbi:YqcC family protein [Catenovulum maritimum]|uniref:YqcC-like domain-containing protein n=1 Tax=Catenovulum maritimum TaxID=1513271 RepID=A0A0J8GRG9_9ALTE|nr:YqcC family protein [Catenovulum maritimum]KMT65297.1 hypothetical protein XM47_09695 [Catenovulum maritimum]
MKTTIDTLTALFTELESKLKQANLWASQAPSTEALASQQPFCIDTLKFEQWLQFIFLPKMQYLVAQKLELPKSLCLLPIAEQVYSSTQTEHIDLLSTIKQIDELFAC